MKTLVGILLVAISSIIFTLQNGQTVEIRAFFWAFEAPLALVIAMSLIFGTAFGIMVSIYAFIIKKNRNNKNKQKSEQNEGGDK